MASHDSEWSKTPLATTLRTARGNASPEAKLHVSKWYGSKGVEGRYIYPILARMEATDVDVFDISEQPGKKQARIVYELDVQEDMCNALSNVHGGCTAALIDVCTSLAVGLLKFYIAPKSFSHVSLALNTTYHSPAPLGSRMKIVCTTVAFGARTATVKAEVYDISHGRLVATGVHVKMQPSSVPPPKL